jgi:predicted transcriptional regulator
MFIVCWEVLNTMDSWYASALDRYEVLVRESIDLDKQQQTIAVKKKKANREIDDLKRYLRNGLEDPEVRAALNKVKDLKNELTQANGYSRKGGPNKTHVIIDLLQKHSENGLTMSDIMEFLQPLELGINRNYVGTVLGKLKERGIVDRQGQKFFLTEAGRSMKVSIYKQTR